MFVLALIGGLFMIDNTEFFNIAEEQLKNGYSWNYVGKTTASGLPALPILDNQNNKVIYYKLTK